MAPALKKHLPGDKDTTDNYFDKGVKAKEEKNFVPMRIRRRSPDLHDPDHTSWSAVERSMRNQNKNDFQQEKQRREKN